MFNEDRPAGEWHDGPSTDDGSWEPDWENSEPTEPIEIKAESYPDLVGLYTKFREYFQPDADVIYHPCNANDISPSIAFPESRVIYVELRDEYATAVRSAGYEAHTTSALEFDPGEVDILLLLNPQIEPHIPESFVKKGGFVLCNNWLDTASEMVIKKQYVLKGMIETFGDNALRTDVEILKGYLMGENSEGQTDSNAMFIFQKTAETESDKEVEVG